MTGFICTDCIYQTDQLDKLSSHYMSYHGYNNIYAHKKTRQAKRVELPLSRNYELTKEYRSIEL